MIAKWGVYIGASGGNWSIVLRCRWIGDWRDWWWHACSKRRCEVVESYWIRSSVWRCVRQWWVASLPSFDRAGDKDSDGVRHFTYRGLWRLWQATRAMGEMGREIKILNVVLFRPERLEFFILAPRLVQMTPMFHMAPNSGLCRLELVFGTKFQHLW